MICDLTNIVRDKLGLLGLYTQCYNVNSINDYKHLHVISNLKNCDVYFLDKIEIYTYKNDDIRCICKNYDDLIDIDVFIDEILTVLNNSII